jgi:hypothetical protein
VRAEAADDAAERLRLWREVEKSGAGSLRAVARAERIRFEARAQAALFAARDAAPSRAAEILAAATAEFDGTALGVDLERVLGHVRKYGAFPALCESAGG